MSLVRVEVEVHRSAKSEHRVLRQGCDQRGGVLECHFHDRLGSEPFCQRYGAMQSAHALRNRQVLGSDPHYRVIPGLEWTALARYRDRVKRFI